MGLLHFEHGVSKSMGWKPFKPLSPACRTASVLKSTGSDMKRPTAFYKQF
jgi:hypothetical protein